MQQGEGIEVLDVSGPLVIADFFVVATAKNHRHAVSMARELERSMKAQGLKRLHTSGIEGESRWILLDFDLVVVHLFEEEARSFYALEALWGDAPRVDYTPPAAPAQPESTAGGDSPLLIDEPFDEDFPGGALPGSPGDDD